MRRLALKKKAALSSGAANCVTEERNTPQANMADVLSIGSFEGRDRRPAG